MNRICVVGRLTVGPKSTTTSSGSVVAEFGVAVDRPMKKDETDFFNVKAWGKTGEFCANYLGKGRLVSISGRMESRKYTGTDGKTTTYWDLVADQVNGLDRKPEGEQVQKYGRPAPPPPLPGEDIEDPFA